MPLTQEQKKSFDSRFVPTWVLDSLYAATYRLPQNFNCLAIDLGCNLTGSLATVELQATLLPSLRVPKDYANHLATQAQIAHDKIGIRNLVIESGIHQWWDNALRIYLLCLRQQVKFCANVLDDKVLKTYLGEHDLSLRGINHFFAIQQYAPYHQSVTAMWHRSVEALQKREVKKNTANITRAVIANHREAYFDYVEIDPESWMDIRAIMNSHLRETVNFPEGEDPTELIESFIALLMSGNNHQRQRQSHQPLQLSD